MSVKNIMEHFVLKHLVIPKSPKVLPNKKHIACIGDSITFGAGVNGLTKQTWEYYLNRIIGDDYQILNYGINGRTLQDEGDYPYRNDKFYRESLQCGAEIYLIMLGTNDAKPYNWNRQRYEQELGKFVNTYANLNHKPIVVLMTPPQCYKHSKTGMVMFDIEAEIIDNDIVDIIKNEAIKSELPLIDLHQFTQNHADLFTDGVHPNKLGNQKIAEFIAEKLIPVI